MIVFLFSEMSDKRTYNFNEIILLSSLQKKKKNVVSEYILTIVQIFFVFPIIGIQ